MALRKVYSCDWCGIDSDVPGCVQGDWTILKNDGSSWICKPCNDNRERHLKLAQAECAKRSGHTKSVDSRSK